MTNSHKEEVKKAAALKYDINTDEAPIVIARGKGEIAAKIIETAKKYNIPIRENQDIIDVLVKLNIGDEIPPKLYQAVAEILSFIYKLE